MSSGYVIPEAIQHFGNIEIGVKPGIVLSSLTIELGAGEEEVDAGEPFAAERLEGLRRDPLHLGELAVAQVGGAHELDAGRIEVLRLEVVEVAARHDDLARDAHARRTAVAAGQHAALHLAARDRLLDEHGGVLCEGDVERGIQLAPVRHLRHADARTRASGLDERGQAERPDAAHATGRRRARDRRASR